MIKTFVIWKASNAGPNTIGGTEDTSPGYMFPFDFSQIPLNAQVTSLVTGNARDCNMRIRIRVGGTPSTPPSSGIMVWEGMHFPGFATNGMNMTPMVFTNVWDDVQIVKLTTDTSMFGSQSAGAFGTPIIFFKVSV